MLHQISGEYLTGIGVSATEVGRTSYLHATLMLKFVWSPIVDLFGTLRGWMLGMQAALGILMGGLALLAHHLAPHLPEQLPGRLSVLRLLPALGDEGAGQGQDEDRKGSRAWVHG